MKLPLEVANSEIMTKDKEIVELQEEIDKSKEAVTKVGTYPPLHTYIHRLYTCMLIKVIYMYFVLLIVAWVRVWYPQRNGHGKKPIYNRDENRDLSKGVSKRYRESGFADTVATQR